MIPEKISFDKWRKMPNGAGVCGATALPQKVLIDSLLAASPGVYWLESPPSSGKTALGQILRSKGWTYVNLQYPGFTIDDQSHEWMGSKCFIDEAQNLDLAQCVIIRGFGALGHCIVCAGTSGAPIPTCPKCESSACKVCTSKKCWQYECSRMHTDVCEAPFYQETISMVIADTPSSRLSIDNLMACPAELTKFLSLFFVGERGICSHIPVSMAAALAEQVGPPLCELTGGLISFIVSILWTLYYDSKVWKSSAPITDAAAHAQAILAAINHPEVVQNLRASRLMVTLKSTERAALVNFVRDRKDVSADDGSSLQKKALLRLVNGQYVPWSPLVFDILSYKLLKDPSRLDCSFDVESCESMMKYIVQNLKETYCDWVLDNSNKEIKHEDEINGAISSILKPATLPVAIHRGPAKRCDKGRYSQVDHAVYWLDGRAPTLIETCLNNVPNHLQRFDAAAGGAYPAAYAFGCGVILVINKTTNPQPLGRSVPTMCQVFHMHAATYVTKRYNGTSRQWEEMML